MSTSQVNGPQRDGSARDLLGVAVQFLRRGQFADARQLCEGVLQQDRKNFDAHYLLGVCLHELGEYVLAEQHFRTSLRLQPDAAQAHLGHGNALCALGRRGDAQDALRRALALQPGLSLASLNLAALLEEEGRHQAALALYEAMLARGPDARAALGRANALLALGQAQQAVEGYSALLELDPRNADALANLAGAFIQLERFVEAALAADSALAAQAQHAGAHLNCAIAYNELHQPGRALASAELAVQAMPGNAEAHYQRARALRRLGRVEQEMAALDTALAMDSRHLGARLDRAAAWAYQQVEGDPMREIDRIVRERPQDARVLFSRSLLNTGLGRFSAARDDALVAARLDGAYPMLRHHIGVLDMLEGNFQAGWRGLEGRFDARLMKAFARSFAQARWNFEEPSTDIVLFVHAEQGMGDTLQIGRLLPALRGRVKRLVVEVQDPLVDIMRRMLPTDISIVRREENFAQFDRHLPLMSVPLALDIDPFFLPPPAVPYLCADPDRVALWRARLGPARGRRIGLCWSGNAAHNGDVRRSIPLQRLTHQLPVQRDAAGGAVGEALEYIGLQNEMRLADFEALAHFPQLTFLGDAIESFEDTAALVELCDVVVSVDTAPAHLAGAMGKPVALLLPFVPDWRWMLERQDTPWYPTMRLFRQRRADDWDPVLAEIASRLRAGPGQAWSAAEASAGNAFLAAITLQSKIDGKPRP